MKTHTGSMLLFAATFVPAAAAQMQDPAPVRIAVDTFGFPSGSAGNPLILELDADGQDGPQLLMFGAGGSTFLVFGTTRVALPGPFQTLLFVSPDAIVPASVSATDRTASLPLDVIRKDLIDATLFVQALCIEGPNVWLSAGLSVRFAAGNAQPTLGYQGPESSAVLIADGAGTGRTHRVLHEVITPTSGYRLLESGRDTSAGVTRIYMTLEAPGQNEITKDVLETRRSVVELGAQAQPRIEVWIAERQRGVYLVPTFLLAASLQRDF